MVAYALAATHTGWGAALLLDARLAIQGYVALASLHFTAGALLLHRKGMYIGAFMSSLILIYYWLLVKPLEPIAEPQSVGLIALSLLLLTTWEPAMRLMRRLRVGDDDSPSLLLARLGVAYPFLEWGLDAARDPPMFHGYLSGNRLAYALVSPIGVETATLALFLIEVSLALLMVLGIRVRESSVAILFLLVLFSLVAAYPLALPQNIALASGALLLSKLGGGRYAVESLLKPSA